MNKLKTFFNSFVKSISSPAYYKDVVKAPVMFSLKYLLFLSYLVMLFYISLFALQMAALLPQLPNAIKTIKQRADSFYPENLVITVRDGLLSTNQTEPVYFDIPELQTDDIDHVITIDTKAQVEDFYDYDTFVLVTDDVVVYPDDADKNYTVTQIEDAEENIVINRAFYEDGVSPFLSLLDQLPAIAPYILIGLVLIVPLFGSVFEFSGNIISIAILSVITLLIALMLKIKLPYKKVFQMGLHAATVPILLMIIVFISGATLPLLYAASFLLWMVIILTQYKENSPVISKD